MTKLMLATADIDFEQRVRTAFKGRVDGQLRYWRDGMLADDPSRMIEELGHRGAEVVALGPGIPTDSRARARSRDRPRSTRHQHRDRGRAVDRSPAVRAARRRPRRDRSRTPRTTSCAPRSNASSTPPATRRSAFDAEDEPVDTTRVILTLCPKGGAGKTTMATNLAIGLARLAPGDVVIVDLDLQFGDVASALGIAPEATFTDATRSLDKLDATDAQGQPRRALVGALRPVRAADADRSRRRDHRADRQGAEPAHRVVQVRGDRHRIRVSTSTRSPRSSSRPISS